jgi:hypothetical protein
MDALEADQLPAKESFLPAMAALGRLRIPADSTLGLGSTLMPQLYPHDDWYARHVLSARDAATPDKMNCQRSTGGR